MTPARRESLRITFDRDDVPEDALARKLISRPVFEFDLENQLRLDNCEICGAIHWRDCVCDPCAPRSGPSAEAVQQARTLRLVRAEISK